MARVSVVVPARNEAGNLAPLLDSLLALEPPPAEIIVVDDHSTDGTGALARARGVAVVDPGPLPPGWLGKPWACAAGARTARGDYLLFTDADTVHAPDSLGLALGTLQRDQVGLASMLPTHRSVAPWEKAQGVFQLLLLAACGGPRSAGGGERRFAIGQYLLFRRDAYLRVGGHGALRDRVAEDLGFARACVEAGEGYALVQAPGALRVRMYPEGLGAFVRGWRRNIREGLGAAGPGAVLELAAIFAFLLAPAVLLAWGAPGWAGALYALTAAEVARRQRALGELPAWGALLYPALAALFALVSALAAWDRWARAPVRWRGREVRLEARR